MKYRLRVLRGNKWALGIVEYTHLEAQTRQIELEMAGIRSRIVTQHGGRI